MSPDYYVIGRRIKLELVYKKGQGVMLCPFEMRKLLCFVWKKRFLRIDAKVFLC